MQNQEKNFKTLVNMTPAAIFITKKDKIIYTNKYTRKIIGYTKKETTNTNFFKIVHPDFHPILQKNLNKRSKGKTTKFQKEIKIITKQGKTRWVSVNSKGIKTKNGIIVLGVSLDITEKKQAEEKLKHSEAKYRALVENSNMAIAVMDKNGKFLFLNKLEAKMQGGVPADFINKSISSIYPKKFTDKQIKIFKQVIKSNKLIKKHSLIKLPSGKKRWIFSSVIPLLDTINKKHLVQVISHDITHHIETHNALKVSEKKFRSFVENAINGAYQSTPQGKIIMANMSLVKMLGYKSIKELKQINTKFLYPSLKKRKEFTGHIEKHGSLSNVEVILKTKNNELITVLENSRVVKNKKGKILYYEGTLIDITERKQIEQTKSDFVSLASHQLRTPLATINWYTEILLQKIPNPLSKDQTQCIKAVASASQRMINLVNNLLSISKLELGTLSIKIRQINISKITRNLLSNLRPGIIEKNLTIHEKFGKSIILRTDFELIQIVLQNLLSNAVKYTKKNGEIKIQILKQKLKKRIFIKIKDNGCGIPKSQQNKIFSKFFRSYNAKKQDTTGTGLGLYIAKSIIYYLNGNIWFKSKHKKGTIFYITLPINLKIKTRQDKKT
ncbi:hypothetical protein CL633_03025 [bacterium]|nr:hypothetical protein [bacterium]|tara:strand:- start:8315 stop:10153 length:1839 start_codon:yes stop_codon:yes gene_type:complete